MADQTLPHINSPEPVIPRSMEPVETPLTARGRHPGWYVAGLGLLLVAACAVALKLAEAEWFLRHDGDPGMRTIGYSRRVGSPNCEIVLWGDSSALTGLSPAVFERVTGLSACNLSESGNVQDVTGSDSALQEYLRHNRPPRFLVSMWTPSLFRPNRAPGQHFYPEGVTYALQYENDFATWRMLAGKVTWLPRYAGWVLNSVVDDTLDRAQGTESHFDARADREQKKGWFPFPRPAETGCVRDRLHITADTIQSWGQDVAAFRRKYATPETQVLVNMSDVPVCDKLYDTYAERAKGLYDNRFERLPIRYYNEGDVHYSPEGAEYVSTQAALQVLALMHGSGSVR